MGIWAPAEEEMESGEEPVPSTLHTTPAVRERGAERAIDGNLK